MTANYNLTAVFTENPPIQYQLHVQTTGSGVTNATGDALYTDGAQVQVLATPNSDWTFSHWLLNGSNVGSANPYLVTMNANYNLTAVFTQIQPTQFQLHVQTSGSGTTNATGDVSYDAGVSVAVLATPNAGWSFNGWILNGSSVGSANPYLLSMTANYNLTAVFTELPPVEYTLHVQVSGQGTTNATGDVAYVVATTVNVLASPDSGWNFTNWLLNGTNAGSTNPYTITMNNNYNLTAVFTQTSQPLFSDDFESGNFNAWTGTTTTTGGTVAVNTARPYSGSYSGVYSVNAGTGVRRAYSYVSFNNIPELYTRAYVYIPSTLALSNGQALWMIQYFNGATPLASYGVRADSTGMHWSVQYGNTPFALGSAFTSDGGWYMLEAYFTHASSGKTIILYVNGTEVTSLSQSTTSLPNVNTVRVGIGYDAGTAALSINVDDVAIYAGSPQIQAALQVPYSNSVMSVKINYGKGNNGRELQVFA
jgi:hypothetical protein